MRLVFVVLAVTLLLAPYGAAETGIATIEGYVRDSNSGNSIPDLRVVVYTSDDHGNIVTGARTDGNGFYSVNVSAGRYYDVYLRTEVGNPNQRTTEDLRAGAVYPVNFNVAVESSYQNTIIDKYGIGIVIAVALLVVMLIVYDQLSSRAKSKGPGLEEIKRERDQLQEMVNMAKAKYHRREIDEESFREITRDQQERLIELESRIKVLEGK